MTPALRFPESIRGILLREPCVALDHDHISKPGFRSINGAAEDEPKELSSLIKYL